MSQHRRPPTDWSSKLDGAWGHARAFFRKRSPVVFFSNERFWEEHGFVQRSLAYALANEGIEVIWVDGAGWRSYTPVVPNRPASLRVVKALQLPMRRVGVLGRLSRLLEARSVKSFLARGKDPFFWVFGGMAEELAEKLPPADVYSVFDNPYANLPDAGLCRHAKAIVCQNEYAEKLFATRAGDKTRRLLPPVEVPRDVAESVTSLPATFPKQVLGYVGAFLGEGLDFEFIEETLVQFPQWGILLVGRTDEAGEAKVQKLSKFPNFHRVGWQSRDRALAYWNVIDVAFFPYGESMGQDGAFAVKILEALYFNKPVLCTEVPKTQDLNEYVGFVENIDELRTALERWQEIPPVSDEEFWKLAWEMDPRVHLARIAGVDV